MITDADLTACSTPRRLRRLARRAHRARRAGAASFDALGAAQGLAPRQLRRLADAWAAGAAAGVEALGPPGPTLVGEVVDQLDDALKGWRRRHHPLEILEWQVWHNRVTVRQVLPGSDRLGPVDRLAIFQLRQTSDGSWHLYRTAALGEWWPVVVVASQRASLSDCLEVVRLDVALQFWPRASTSATRSHPV